MPDIAIASGKGGTGKTLVSVSLAAWCAREGISIALLDCDVEEPNANLFLNCRIDSEEIVNVLIPHVDDAACTGCGKCEELCAYSAIVLLKGKPLVLPEMCHSCGGCFLICPEKAISEIPRRVGSIATGTNGSLRYAGGVLNLGEPMAPPVIREVKRIHHAAALRIIDSPPGTSCPVVEALRGCDFALLVTEPTPFGKSDLALAVETCRAMKIPFAVIINRDGAGDGSIDEYCNREKIPIIARIPYSRHIAEAYASGKAIEYMLHTHYDELKSIFNYTMQQIKLAACS